MRIHDGSGRELTGVYLALSDDEAWELIGALEGLREAKPESQFHQHVSQADYQREITVYREDDPTTVF